MHDEQGSTWARILAEQVTAGRLSRLEAEEQLAERFGEQCPDCRRTFEEAVVALYAPAVPELSAGRWSPSAPPPVPPRLGPGGKPKRCRALPAAVLEARGLAAFETLKRHNWWRRRERIRLEWQRFRGVAVARRMMAAAVAALPGDPEESGNWADMVLMVLSGDRHRDVASTEALTLRLHARLLLANAARCRGELDEALDKLLFIQKIAEDLGLRELPFWVEAKRYATPALRARRDFPAAVRCARVWSALARAADLPQAQVQAGWSLATVHEQRGDFEAALATIQRARSLAENLSDVVVRLGVVHFEANALARLGHFSEAEALQRQGAPLYQQVPNKENYRSWVGANIHAGLGRVAQAEESYRQSRDGFLATRNPYDAALVTLDWSLALLEQRRFDEVPPLALAMGQAFEALGVARETLAAWAVVQQAANGHTLSRLLAAEMVRELAEPRRTGPALPRRPTLD